AAAVLRPRTSAREARRSTPSARGCCRDGRAPSDCPWTSGDSAQHDSAMTDSSAAAPLRSNLPAYTVSEISLLLKRTVEQNFAYVRVRGEISGFKRHSSGHCYLALKDEEAALDAVIWRTTAQRMSLKPEDGMEVVCAGKLTTYPGRSKYQ